MDSTVRRQNYRQGIVYTTGKELLADFLRDRLMTHGDWNAARWQLQRQLETAGNSWKFTGHAGDQHCYY